MASYAVPIVPKRAVDFAGLASTFNQDVILADRIDLLQWREVTLAVRVHSNSVASGAGTITIMVLPQSWTPEDPGILFVGSLGSAGQVVITSSTAASTVLTDDLPMAASPCMTAMGRLIARGNRTAGGTLKAEISVDFSVKQA